MSIQSILRVDLLDPQDLGKSGSFPMFFEVFKDYINGKLKHEDLKGKIETWTHQELDVNFI